MAEVAGPSVQSAVENSPPREEESITGEPECKKAKLEISNAEKGFRLEERLNGILCCAVCLDLPTVAVYQVGDHILGCCSLTSAAPKYFSKQSRAL